MRASSASGSTASDREMALRLVDCPSCGDRIIRIRSKKEGTYDEFYYKCPNNIRDDPTTCGFIRSEKQYAAFLRNLEAKEEGIGRFKVAEHGLKEEQGYGNLKDAIEALKRMVEMHSLEISTLKMQMLEDKEGGQKTVLVDNTVLFSLCIGIVIGILVTVMLK
ncbi:hypothetical protein BS78_02G061200 [Paspalum vaginatum]|nr:hypothetical protein BS78_02G061200 [Paspalum vaginatum]